VPTKAQGHQHGFLRVSAEVSAALQRGAPVVALESTIISHGMPYPQNLETALQARRALRPPRFQRLSCTHSVPGCASRAIRRPASAAGGGSREGARRDACDHRRPGRRAARGPDRRAAAPYRRRVRTALPSAPAGFWRGGRGAAL